MRKHFLILMLMALLPLAGFAESAYNLSSVAEVRAVYPQGLTEIVYNAQDRSGIAWTFEYRAENSTEWVAIDKAQCDITFHYGANGASATTDVKNAGTYYVGIAAKTAAEDYSGAVPEGKRPSFIIKQFPLTIQANGTEKVYGDADPTTLTWDVVNDPNLPEPKENIDITFAYNRAEGVAAAGTADGEKVNADGYALTCTATAVNYKITVTGSPKLIITRAPLTIYYDKQTGTPDYSKNLFATYGQVPATITGVSSKVKAEGWKTIGGNADTAPTSWGTVKLTPKAITANVAGSEASSSTTVMTGKTAHEVEISLSTVTKDESGDKVKYLYGDNYEVFYVNPKLYVKQATIEIPTSAPSVGDYAFTFAKNKHDAYTYNGTSQAPKYTIKYGKVKTVTTGTSFSYTLQDDAVTLSDAEENGDFTYAWKWLALGVTGTATADEHNNVWAGTYTPFIKAVATGNYYTATAGVELAADEYKYEIAKKSLAVYAADDSKTYNGQPVSLDQSKVQWSGLIAADQTAAATATKVAKDYFELKFVDNDLNTTAPVNQGTYKVKPVAKAAPAGTDEFYTLWYTNYTPQYSQSNFKVDPKAITITALPQSIKFGETVAITTEAKLDDTTTANVNEATVDLGEIVSGQETDMLSYLELALVDGDYTVAKPYEEAIEVKVKDNTGLNANAITTKTTFLANYKITPAKGTFTISKSTFKMFAKANSVIYGDEYDLTSASGFDFGTLGFEGKIAEDAEITYTLEDEEGKPVDHPTDAGSYQINLKLADKDIPAGYDDPEYIKGTFTILPRPITVTPVAQALQKGAKESELATYNTNNAKVKFSYTGDDEKDAIINNDAVAYDLIFNVQTASEEGLIPSAQVTFVSGSEGPRKLIDAATETSYNKGITVKAGVNKNYVITAGTGALTVIGANTLVLDTKDVDLAAKIGVAATACATPATTYTAMFANRTLKANTWYTMVLPFDVKTTELVANLKAKDEVEAGQQQTYHEVYAIVNTLSANSTANHISYTLEMNKVAANVPFLIKVAEDVDLQDVKFTTKKILNGATTVGDGQNYGGNKFVGVYTATTIKSGTPANTVYGFLGDPDFTEGMKNEWYEPANNAWTVNPMEAYLIYSPNKTVSAPLITVEDFGGQTTAISEVKAGEFQEVKTDGWYTIDGIKLQAAPTEKGIYINNGKKIVVK